MINIEKEIMAILINKFGMEESQAVENETFSNIGFDSIAIIELRSEIMKKFGLGSEDLSITVDDSVRSLQNKIYPFIK